jgi:hypothetical protein
MVDGSVALALEGLSFALMVDCLSIFLEIGMVFHFHAIICFKSRLLC